MANKSQRILVAMSGGVDSSVAAAILAESGHDVVGVMMRLWSDPYTENLCCTPDSMAIARKVANQLRIPFHTIDAVTAFRSQVVQYFIEGYKNGETPNPCVVCNRYFRWHTLRDKALELDTTHIASGHYARIHTDPSGRFQLMRAVDPGKDQSYVLHGLSQELLSKILFPIGDYTKTEIRAWAHKMKLPVAERPDSQDLCFVGEDGYRDFLLRHAPEVLNPGLIKNRSGETLGEHKGLAFYTIGQRKGLRIAADMPFYVLEKDIQNNILVIGGSEELGRQELTAGKVNWISNKKLSDPIRAHVKIRYQSPDIGAIIIPLNNDHVQVKFDQPVRDITPGQAAVFYQDEVCLGGGMIL